MSLNRCVFIGRLTADPECSYTPSGIATAKFTLAVDRDFGKNPETGDKETDFIKMVAWRRQAEFIQQYIAKGRLVAIEGRLQIRTWVNQQGQKQWMTEIQVENVQALDRARDHDGPNGNGFNGYESELPNNGYNGYGQHREPAMAGVGAGNALDEGDPFADE